MNMSSELRLKKLRGSGGYVMATVSDDQQRKGNLGGPDLFLAPIGRIDSEKISKFHCNSCEKDFEGPPKIDYETPNEVVADNLVLSEKGQYICTTCGSVIAEYRNFQKPDEGSEVGSAKPESMQEQIVENSSVSESTSQSTVSPDFSLPEMTPTIQDESTSSTSHFSSIVGLAVYDSNAKKIGTVKSAGTQSGQLVVIIMKNDGNDTAIRWQDIAKVGEIILLQEGVGAVGGSKCANCSFNNNPDSKFCESCGGKL